MSRDTDAAAGVDLARRMLLKMADSDDAVGELNTAAEAEVRWALAYLLSIVREQAMILGRHTKPRRSWQDVIRTAAEGIDRDIIETQLAAAVDEIARGGGLDG